MSTLTPALSSEESFDRALQKVGEDLELQLNPIVPSTDIYFTARNLHITKVYWVGYIDLQILVENLPTLEKESPYMYNYLRDNHNGVIDGAKKLLAKLKLQESLLPGIVVKEDNSRHYPRKPIKRRILVNSEGNVWQHFYAACPDTSMAEAENQTKEYFGEVRPLLEGLCEMIASTAYEHLTSVSKSLRAEYSQI